MLGRLLLLLLAVVMPVGAFAKTSIFGEAEVGVDDMYEFVCRHNPEFQREVAEAFYDIGSRYGIRGDVALCQAIVETGWFRFDNGTAVKPEAHNYCGLGVRRRGDEGCRFDSVDEGVTAMIQHLYAYASTKRLPKGERMVDPRFSYVRRGCARTWEDLSGKWAMNGRYGKNILRIYDGLSAFAKSAAKRGRKEVRRIEVVIPDEVLDSDSLDRISPEYVHDVDSTDVRNMFN